MQHMKIVPELKPIELSYLDLINALHDDIKSDELMPEFVKDAAIEHLEQLKTIIEPYSA